MKIIRIYRLIKLALIVLEYLFRASLIHLCTSDPLSRRKRFAANVTRACRKGLRALNITVKVQDLPPEDKRFLIVSNHLGFIDIFAISSVMPTLFVTSVEMKETPLLGLLTEMGGCMYVERRNRSNIQKEIKEIENTLNQGFNVVLFPEGLSTNGEKVFPFKKSLLMACAGSDANIMPLVINFESINHEPMQHKFRDWVFWYGDIPFIRSAWNASQMNDCQISLRFLGEIVVSGDSNHRDIAQIAQTKIEANYKSIPLPQKA